MVMRRMSGPMWDPVLDAAKKQLRRSMKTRLSMISQDAVAAQSTMRNPGPDTASWMI